MAITITIPSTGQQVIVNAGPTLKSLGTDVVLLDGSSQIIHEQPGGATSQLAGYIDLSNLIHGDTVVIRFLVRLIVGGLWGACYEETYSGVQSLPIIHVAKRPENHGIKVIIQQTTGIPKSITYEFFEES